MTPPAPPRLPRGPFVLLGLMTATTLMGPLGIGLALRGGASPNWPPDRPVEWVVAIGTCAAVAVLMAACLGLAVVNRRAPGAATRPAPPPAPDATPGAKP